MDTSSEPTLSPRTLLNTLVASQNPEESIRRAKRNRREPPAQRPTSPLVESNSPQLLMSPSRRSKRRKSLLQEVITRNHEVAGSSSPLESSLKEPTPRTLIQGIVTTREEETPVIPATRRTRPPLEATENEASTERNEESRVQDSEELGVSFKENTSQRREENEGRRETRNEARKARKFPPQSQDDFNAGALAFLNSSTRDKSVRLKRKRKGIDISLAFSDMSSADGSDHSLEDNEENADAARGRRGIVPKLKPMISSDTGADSHSGEDHFSETPEDAAAETPLVPDTQDCLATDTQTPSPVYTPEDVVAQSGVMHVSESILTQESPEAADDVMQELVDAVDHEMVSRADVETVAMARMSSAHEQRRAPVVAMEALQSHSNAGERNSLSNALNGTVTLQRDPAMADSPHPSDDDFVDIDPNRTYTPVGPPRERSVDDVITAQRPPTTRRSRTSRSDGELEPEPRSSIRSSTSAAEVTSRSSTVDRFGSNSTRRMSTRSSVASDQLSAVASSRSSLLPDEREAAGQDQAADEDLREAAVELSQRNTATQNGSQLRNASDVTRTSSHLGERRRQTRSSFQNGGTGSSLSKSDFSLSVDMRSSTNTSRSILTRRSSARLSGDVITRRSSVRPSDDVIRDATIAEEEGTNVEEFQEVIDFGEEDADAPAEAPTTVVDHQGSSVHQRDDIIMDAASAVVDRQRASDHLRDDVIDEEEISAEDVAADRIGAEEGINEPVSDDVTHAHSGSNEVEPPPENTPMNAADLEATPEVVENNLSDHIDEPPEEEDIAEEQMEHVGMAEDHAAENADEAEEAPSHSRNSETRNESPPHSTPQPNQPRLVQKLLAPLPASSGTPARFKTPTAPPAQAKSKVRKEPSAKPQRKQHVSQEGVPTRVTKEMIKRFSHNRIKPDAISAIENLTDKFFRQISGDLEAFANHAGRSSVTFDDVELLMKRQGFVTDKVSLSDRVRQYLPMELRRELIPCALSKGQVYPKKGIQQ